MSSRIVAALIVSFVSACGGLARRPATTASAPTEAVVESTPEDDYVVGPFISSSGTDHEVRTYYIVRN